MLLVNLLFYSPLFFSLLGGQPATIDLPYTSFLQQVERGNVTSVTMTGDSVSGIFKTPITGQTTGPQSGATAFTHFTTYVPATGDSNLLALLEKKGVEVRAQPVEPSWWQTVLELLLNALLLLYFGVMSWRGLRQAQGGRLFGFGRSRAKLYSEERPKTAFADVAGVDEVKLELREVIDFLRDPHGYLKIGAHIPRGILLIGPSGTGKTLLARAVASEAGVPFFSSSATDFVELFVGVGASRVRDLFAQARQHAPCIIFIDEMSLPRSTAAA